MKIFAGIILVAASQVAAAAPPPNDNFAAAAVQSGTYWLTQGTLHGATSEANEPVLTGYPDVKTNEDYVLKNIQFKYNNFALLETSFQELDRVVEILKFNKAWKVTVSGHTDDIGSDAFNLDLSLNRAGSVADYLISKGIDPARIKTWGFGKQTPLAKGSDEAARAINRRVEIRFLN